MNNTVVFAAAGNGKTYSLCSEAKKIASESKKEVLIISYTNEGKAAIENEYKKQNFGVVDKKVIIKTWYSFVLSDLIKPFQCKLDLKYKKFKQEFDFPLPEHYVKSIAFYETEKVERYYGQNHVQYYINSVGDLHKDNVGALACKCISDSNNAVIIRLEKIYSHILIDELQDYAGWDLEIFRLLFMSAINICCVGDYKQSTFRTNNSQKNKQYRDENIKAYFCGLEKKRICKIEYSNKTRRFNQEICDFVNTIHNDKDCMVVPVSDLEEGVTSKGVYIIDNSYASIYCNYFKPTILRYERTSKIEFEHNCRVFNYGNSKGATFERVVIIPVSTVIPFIKQKKPIVSSQTRAKFYVACTRAKYSIVFVMNNPSENEHYKRTTISLGDYSIPAFKYVP